MRIGIIGTGNMGRAIGVRLAHLGHDVLFGSRDPRRGQEAASLAGRGARAGGNDDAARHGEVLVWTVREPDPTAVLGDSALLDGKVVVDINNRDYAREVQGGAWFGRAIAEVLQAHAPRARVVKALNVVAMETLGTDPEGLRAAGAQVFVAGDDAETKRVVAELVGELGFEAVDLGTGPVAMRAAEALGDVIRLLMIGAKRGGRANLQVRTLPGPNLGGVGPRTASNYR